MCIPMNSRELQHLMSEVSGKGLPSWVSPQGEEVNHSNFLKEELHTKGKEPSGFQSAVSPFGQPPPSISILH